MAKLNTSDFNQMFAQSFRHGAAVAVFTCKIAGVELDTNALFNIQIFEIDLFEMQITILSIKN